jgi:hypothetical protein
MNKKKAAVIAVWLVTLFLLWTTIRAVPLTAAFHTLRRFKLWEFAVLTLLNGLIVVFLTARWWLILWGLGHKLPFSTTIGHRLASFGVSYFTPGPQFGGEVVQVLLVEKRHAVPRTTAVSSVALDKSIELLVNFLFLLMGMLIILQSHILTTDNGWETVALPLLLLTIPLLYLTAVWRGYHPLTQFVRFFHPLFDRRPSWARIFETAVSGLAASEKQAGDFCHHAPRFLWAAVAISLVGWVMMVIEFGATLTFLGADITLLQAVMILTVVRIGFLLPVPGGLGVIEAALLLALPQFNIDPSISISASVLIHGRDVLLSLVGLWWGKYFLKRTA